VAVRGPGWIAVQAPDGGEAYTRAGDLKITALGQLQTGSGLPVVGNGGPIAVT
jgi:flagellar basal-body rod protein FlgF